MPVDFPIPERREIVLTTVKHSPSIEIITQSGFEAETTLCFTAFSTKICKAIGTISLSRSDHDTSISTCNPLPKRICKMST